MTRIQRLLSAFAFCLVCVSAVACVTDTAVKEDAQVETVTNHDLEGTVIRTTIDGMPCIVWYRTRHDDGSGRDSFSGLTCDWRDR